MGETMRDGSANAKNGCKPSVCPNPIWMLLLYQETQTQVLRQHPGQDGMKTRLFTLLRLSIIIIKQCDLIIIIAIKQGDPNVILNQGNPNILIKQGDLIFIIIKYVDPSINLIKKRMHE